MRHWFNGKAQNGGIAAMFAIGLIASACATAPTPDRPDDEGPDAGQIFIADAGTNRPDAMEPDAGPTQVTLSQNTSDMVVEGGAVACQNGSGTAENSWYRVFDLEALGITTTFLTEKVSVGFEIVERNGGVPVDVKLHTLNGTFVGTFNRANLTQVSETTIVVPEAAAMTVVEFPMSANVEGGSQLVIEVHVANLLDTGDGVVIGGNALGQTAEAFYRAPACSYLEPVITATPGFPDAHLIMSVTGSY